MTLLLTREELDRLLIQALIRARTAEPVGEDPDYGLHCRAQDNAAAEHGVKRWLR
jgi:hypothetical protein